MIKRKTVIATRKKTAIAVTLNIQSMLTSVKIYVIRNVILANPYVSIDAERIVALLVREVNAVNNAKMFVIATLVKKRNALPTVTLCLS